MNRKLLASFAVALLMGPFGSSATAGAHGDPNQKPDGLVLRWNDALLQAVRNVRFGPVFTARAAAVVHTAMYDAWSAYDRKALPTQDHFSWRRPRAERTVENKRIAVSYAAYRALVDLFPSQKDVLFDPLLLDLGLDPSDASMDPTTPAGIGTSRPPRSSHSAIPTVRTSGATSTGGHRTRITPAIGRSTPPTTWPIPPAGSRSRRPREPRHFSLPIGGSSLPLRSNRRASSGRRRRRHIPPFVTSGRPRPSSG